MGMVICLDGVARELRPTRKPKLPEFAFSPRKGTRPPRAQRMPVAPIYGPPVPPGLYAPAPRPKGEKQELRPSEEAWRQGRSAFPNAELPPDHKLPPAGTAPSLDAMGKFLNRVAEINAIASIVCCDYHAKGGTSHRHSAEPMELTKVSDELAALGLGSISLSSDDDSDDDSTADAYIGGPEHSACRYGTGYLTAELAPMVRRIEWERFVWGCGPMTRVQMVVVDGQLAAIDPDVKGTPSPELRSGWARTAARAYKVMGKPDLATLDNNQARARFYGAVGSRLEGLMHGVHPAVEEAINEVILAEDEDTDGGPEELGLHNLHASIVLHEPTAAELWPEDYLYEAV